MSSLTAAPSSLSWCLPIMVQLDHSSFTHSAAQMVTHWCCRWELCCHPWALTYLSSSLCPSSCTLHSRRLRQHSWTHRNPINNTPAINNHRHSKQASTYNDSTLNSQVCILEEPDLNSRLGLEELKDQKLYIDKHWLSNWVVSLESEWKSFAESVRSGWLRLIGFIRWHAWYDSLSARDWFGCHL